MYSSKATISNQAATGGSYTGNNIISDRNKDIRFKSVQVEELITNTIRSTRDNNFLLIDADLNTTGVWIAEQGGSVGGDLGVQGNTILAADLNVQGASSFLGDVTFVGAVTHEGDLDVTGDLGVTGQTTLHHTSVIGTLGTSGTATLAALSVPGTSTLQGTTATTLSTSGAATLASASVTGNASVGGTTTLQGTTATTLSTSGAATLASASVTGNASVGGTTTLQAVTATTLGTSSQATLASAVVAGNSALHNTTVTGTLNVTSTSALHNTTVTGTLSTTAAATLNSAIVQTTIGMNKTPAAGFDPYITMPNGQNSGPTAEFPGVLFGSMSNGWLVGGVNDSPLAGSGFNFIRTDAGPGVVAYIDTGGAYHQLSDVRIKENIAALDHGLDTILKFQPKRYTMVHDKMGKTQLGLLAQEVLEVCPEVVSSAGMSGELGLNYTALIPVLINAIQELNQKLQEPPRKKQRK